MKFHIYMPISAAQNSTNKELEEMFAGKAHEIRASLAGMQDRGMEVIPSADCNNHDEKGYCLGHDAAPSCPTCNGHGMVGGHVGQTPEQFDYVSEPCPDCSAPAGSGEAVGKLMHDYCARAMGVSAPWHGLSDADKAIWDGCAAEMFSHAARHATTPDGEAVAWRDVVGMLIRLTHDISVALDDSEEREGEDGREHVISSYHFDAISNALDELEALPDDRPGYTMAASGKAQWALRGLFATPPAPDARPAGYVRYCRECSYIGEVPAGVRDCCPDGNHALYVHPDIADQAARGFARKYLQPAQVPGGYALISIDALQSLGKLDKVQHACTHLIAASDEEVVALPVGWVRGLLLGDRQNHNAIRMMLAAATQKGGD